MQQQQIMMQQQMINFHEEKNFSRKNIIFENFITSYRKTISAKYGTKVEDVLKEYIQKISENIYKRYKFIFNTEEIQRNEQRVVEDFFKQYATPKILVLEQ